MGDALNICILYADKSTAELGERLSRTLRRKLGGHFRFAQSTWNAELLRSPKLRKLAAEDAARSDILIVATPEEWEVPRELASWIRLWQDRPHDQPAALVALLSEPHAGSPQNSPLRESLKAAAEKAHMEFFCNDQQLGKLPPGKPKAKPPSAPARLCSYRDADPSKQYTIHMCFS
jgi:hypothetical protein